MEPKHVCTETAGKTAVIIASRPVSAGMRRYLPMGAFVITADAGWKNAEALGLSVDLALGDWDSSQPPHSAREVLTLPAEKDDTDTHYATREALARGYRRIVYLGALGGRLDHQHANLQTMLFATQNGAQCLAAAEGIELHCLAPGALELPRDGWRWLSVFAAGGATEGVTLRGVKYPLDGARLDESWPLGVSNEFAAPVARVECTCGCLYVMLTCDE